MNRLFVTAFFSATLLFWGSAVFSQNIGVNSSGNSPVASALMDIDASPANNKGLLIPRMLAAEKTAIASPANGLLIYQTDAPIGFWYYDATLPAWVQWGAAGSSGWSLSGNALTGGTSATPTEFIGSTNNYDWVVKTNNTERVRLTAAGYLGIGTSITTPSQLLHLASTGVNTVMRYETQGVPSVGNVDWSTGTDYSDWGKFKISKASTLTTNNYLTIDGLGAVGIGTATINASAIFEATSTTKGLLMPRIALTTTSSALPTTSPYTGLIVYNTATVSDVSPGFYVWNGTLWFKLGGFGWLPVGNAGTVSTNFIGTTDDRSFYMKLNNTGSGILDSPGAQTIGLPVVTNASLNTALGYDAMSNTPVGNRGEQNAAFGYQALKTSYSGQIGQGYANVGVGYQTLSLIASQASFGGDGNSNVAVGYQAMKTNDIGYDNVGIGSGALYSNTQYEYLTAVGAGALGSCDISSNTAIGYFSQKLSTDGYSNTSLGSYSLYNSNGDHNVALGVSALSNAGGTAMTGTGNIALGNYALKYNTTGNYNIAIGTFDIVALTGAGKTNITGSNNIFIGYRADAAVDGLTNATAIGNGAVVSTSNTMKFGNASVTDNYFTGNVNATCGVLVCSDARYKKEILRIPLSLDKVLQLNPVNYYFKTAQELKDDGVASASFYGGNPDEKQIGFIAQEVEKLFPELVRTAPDGYKSIDYSRLTPILVRAIQERKETIDRLESDNESLQSDFENLESENNDLRSAIASLRSDYASKLKLIEEMLALRAGK